MKLAIFLSTISIFVASFSFGQTTDLSKKRVVLHRKIPEFLKAENSNFVVNVITLPALVDRDRVGVDEEIGSPERLDYARWSGPNPELFEEITRLLKERLAELSLYPAAVNNLDTKKLLDYEFLSQHYASIAKLKAGYSIDITVLWWNETIEAYKDNNLSLEDIRIMSLSVLPFQKEQAKDAYGTGGLNLSVSEALNRMNEDIRKMPDDFFVSEMEIDDSLFSSGVFNPETLKKQYVENESYSVFPHKNRIDTAKVLVLFKREFRRAETKDALGYLKRILPNEYHVVDQITLPDALEQDYDYLLVPKYELIERYVFEGVGDPEVETLKERRYYYVIKDLRTLNVFNGMTVEQRKDRSSFDPALGLRKLLVDMRKHYDW